MGSDERHFNVSLIVRDKVTRQCPQTTTFEEKGEPKRIRTEVPLLTTRPNRLTAVRLTSNWILNSRHAQSPQDDLSEGQSHKTVSINHNALPRIPAMFYAARCSYITELRSCVGVVVSVLGSCPFQ